MAQVIQVIGALMVLAAFAALQAGLTTAASRPYLIFNLVGSLVLTVLAIHEHQWGFLLLESVWALVSAWSLGRTFWGEPPGETG
jgi:hypothetical protein